MSSQQKVKPRGIFGNVNPNQVKPVTFAGLPRPATDHPKTCFSHISTISRYIFEQSRISTFQ